MPSGHGRIKPNVSTFHERFSGSTDSCEALEPSRARLNNIKLGGNLGKIYSTTVGTARLCANSGVATANNEFLSWFNAAPAVAATPVVATPTVMPTIQTQTTPQVTTVQPANKVVAKPTAVTKLVDSILPRVGGLIVLLSGGAYVLRKKSLRPPRHAQFDAPHVVDPAASVPSDPTRLP